MSETVISIKDLSKSFGDHEVLRKIDIDVHSGEVICIVGSSGSGKSTLLRCINKLEKQTSGKILYHDKEVRNVQKDINDYRSKVGMVFQSFNLFNNMTVLQNCILTLASQLSGLDENVFQEVNEKLREEGGFTSFLRGLPRAKGYISRNEKFKSDDRLFEYQSQIINELADKESCVIVGKCADYVLKNRPNVVSIYIEAPRAFCVERTIANMGVTPEVANATIERTDKFRADYYKYYTHGNYWTNPVNYDLTLNSERVGVENCVKTIEQYLIIKGFIKADMIKPVGELI